MGSCLSADGRSGLPGSPTSESKRKNGRRRRSMRSSSFDYKRDEQLRRIAGRMFLNGASEVASLFTQQGRKGTNQDAMIVWENFGSRTDTVFCGVFDGHGPYGHLVAKRVRDSLPLKLSAHWEVNIGSEGGSRELSTSAMVSMNSEDTSFMYVEEESRESIDIEENKKHPEIFLTLKESFLKAFKVMDKELKLHPNIDCFCSGTTAVTLVKQGQDLIIGNVGDSRAILGTRNQDDALTAVQLTVDLKPNLPVEAERIRQCRGRVFALRDEPEVSRVWLPNNDSPGLAMARAFGDFCLKDFGLISVPEISYRRLTERDEFVVMATDGVWDVLSNKEVVDIVASAPARSTAARSLVESAVRAWKFKYPTSKIDDCAVVCLFLVSDSNNSCLPSKAEEQSAAFYQRESSQEKQQPQSAEGLNRSATVRAGPEIQPEEEEEEPLNEAARLMGIGEWSALEGVSRVNTLLTLPRFVAENEEDKQPTGGTKTWK
ncbi:probable protein phosphatase 2C 33 [Macadamia integrifolia]|uniref:probable protein phosphatase 2C 33 n=1 Tax=Macadamia integrifolia TaxID=60698 RepID=UPI001C531765|nr:probable protein phosphatase 2C 33 [Macadamia integrifolia]XP_042480892.1 probable protein phosphatase 2C 33 [Macadamia integrifolia]XP_042480893.1 probable protein phosphatase 2C 33 [Macadamia integrifolia]XP_042480895.1 probable protein phosphatase 2C 33 [Macadamia integrifolia]